jgi:spore germination protein YaaH
MTRPRPFVVGALALGALSLASGPARAALQSSSWITYIDQSTQTIAQYGSDFQAVSVFAYDFDVNNNLKAAEPWVDAELAARKAAPVPGQPTYVTIVNDVESVPPVAFSGTLIDTILADPVQRAAHVAQLVAVSSAADGVDIDYEALLPTTSPNFTLFIQELRAALPAGKKLSVVAQPKTNNTVGPRGQAIDWAGIAPYVDVIRVMTYYYAYGSSAPGASAPILQTQAIANFALSEIPAAKLSIVLTLFGWDWPAGGTGTPVSYQQAMATAAQYGATPFRDPVDQYLRVNYTDATGVAHQIWIDDDTSLQAKISVIEAAGTDRIDYWSLGTGDPAFWAYVTAQTAVAAVPSLASVSPSSATAGGPGFTLTVSGANFTPDAAVRWNGAARAASFINASLMTAAISSGDVVAAGAASVTVANSTGVSNAEPFAIAASTPLPANAAPVLASLSPSSATAGGSGFSLGVNGANFISSSTVLWNGVGRATVFVSSARLTAAISTADLAAPATAFVSVFTPGPGGGTSTASGFFVVAAVSTGTVNPVPALASLSPSSATAGSRGFNLSLFGANFVGGSTAQWNGLSRGTVFVSSTQLTAALLTADLSAPTTASVTVFSPGPGGGTSTAAGFFVVAAVSTAAVNPVPALASLSPSSATAGSSGLSLSVFGANFIGGSTVLWNGLGRAAVFVSSAQLTAAILASDLASPTTAALTVSNPGPGGGTSAAVGFLVSAAVPVVPAPTLALVSPSSATVGSLDFALELFGAGFVGGSTALWNGQTRATVFVSSAQLSATLLPADLAAPSAALLTVSTPGPGGGTSAPIPFSVLAAAPAAATGAAFGLRAFYAFPNPSRRGQPVVIRLQAGVADAVDVRVYDLTGARVNEGSPGAPQILDDGNGLGPQYTYDYLWDASGVGSGIYVCVITARKAGQPDIRRTSKVGVLK